MLSKAMAKKCSELQIPKVTLELEVPLENRYLVIEP